MSAVWKRELRAYMNNVYGWLFMSVLLLFTGVLVAVYNLIGLSTDIRFALSFGEYALIVMVPIICMRSMSEDKRNKTDMFYLSLPLKTSAVVLGKYFALLTVLAIPTAVLCAYPLIFSLYGQVDFATSYTALLAFFLLGAGILAVCQFISSLTENLVVSAVLGIAVLLVLYFVLPVTASLLPQTPLASYIGFCVLALVLALIAYLSARSLILAGATALVVILPMTVLYLIRPTLFAGALPSLTAMASPFAQFEYMAIYGLFDLGSVLVFLSYAVLFVFLTVGHVDRKRYM